MSEAVQTQFLLLCWSSFQKDNARTQDKELEVALGFYREQEQAQCFSIRELVRSFGITAHWHIWYLNSLTSFTLVLWQKSWHVNSWVMLETSLGMPQMVPSAMNASLDLWSCKIIFKAFNFSSRVVSHPVSGWSLCKAINTSRPCAIATFVMWTSLNEDLVPCCTKLSCSYNLVFWGYCAER